MTLNREHIGWLKQNRHGDQVFVDDHDALKTEQDELEKAVDSQKGLFMKAKRNHAKETAKNENSESEGQPVRAKLEEMLHQHGVHRGAQHAGKFQGPACRKLLQESGKIHKELTNYVISLDSRVEGISDTEILEVCDAHTHHLHAFDGFISGMHTKRCHLTAEIKINTKASRDQCAHLERRMPGMSMTTKAHIDEKHACEQQEEHDGVGDMEESFGWRDHQKETRADARHGGAGVFFTRERNKGMDEALSNDLKVQVAKTELQQKRKRKHDVLASQAAVTAETKRAKHAQQRSDALTMIVPTGELVSLVENRK